MHITLKVSRAWLYLWALVKLGFKRDVRWLFGRAIRIE